MEDVRKKLLPDHADLTRAAALLGPEALPHLQTLVEGDDIMLASRATVVAGLIPDPRGAEIVQRAANSNEKAVRVAAAIIAKQMPPESAGAVLTTLLRDEDAETRGMAIDAVKPESPTDVHEALDVVAKRDPNPYLRERSQEAQQRCRH